MSAGEGQPTPKVSNDLSLLAPKFAQAVIGALAACRAAGLDTIVYEAMRSAELQALYYARGRTIIPPTPSRNQCANQFCSAGMAMAWLWNVIDRTKFWKPAGGEDWFRAVAVIFKQHECNWGGDWKNPDTPHFQWHLCKPSPSADAQQMMKTQGAQAVWRAVSAL